MAEYEEFEIGQGTDVTVELHLVTQDGAAKDLTDHSVAASLKKSYNDSAGEATSFSSQIISPNTSGKIALTLTNTQTTALRKGRHVYDVELSFTDSDGETVTERILEGRINVTPSVT
jgi:hypothetical protein